ncbi:hypothetical protein ACLOJK_023501 [Asimina triloba]
MRKEDDEKLSTVEIPAESQPDNNVEKEEGEILKEKEGVEKGVDCRRDLQKVKLESDAESGRIEPDEAAACSRDDGLQAIMGRPLLFTKFGKCSKVQDSVATRGTHSYTLFNIIYFKIYSSPSTGVTIVGRLFWQLLTEGMDSMRDGHQIWYSIFPKGRPRNQLADDRQFDNPIQLTTCKRRPDHDLGSNMDQSTLFRIYIIFFNGGSDPSPNSKLSSSNQHWRQWQDPTTARSLIRTHLSFIGDDNTKPNKPSWRQNPTVQTCSRIDSSNFTSQWERTGREVGGGSFPRFHVTPSTACHPFVYSS